MMWENKTHPNCLYIDSRKEVNPDEVQDYRNLPYPNESFKLIVFDPPHILRKEHWDNSAEMEKNFGFLIPETWQSDLKKAFKELWRVLKPYGILIFKWSNYSIIMERVLALAPTKPLFSQKMNFKRTSNGRLSYTGWTCFMKIPENVELLANKGNADLLVKSEEPQHI